MILYEEYVNVEPMSEISSEWSTGTVLTISRMTPELQGNYTCAPSTVTPASVKIHVIDEEGNIPSAAVYGDSSAANLGPSLLLFSLVFVSIV